MPKKKRTYLGLGTPHVSSPVCHSVDVGNGGCRHCRCGVGVLGCWLLAVGQVGMLFDCWWVACKVTWLCMQHLKYILVVPQNIYRGAQIFIWLCRYSYLFAEIFRLAQKYLGYPPKIIHCHGKLCAAQKYFPSPYVIFVCAWKFSFLMHRFFLVPSILGMLVCLDYVNDLMSAILALLTEL